MTILDLYPKHIFFLTFTGHRHCTSGQYLHFSGSTVPYCEIYQAKADSVMLTTTLLHYHQRTKSKYWYNKQTKTYRNNNVSIIYSHCVTVMPMTS